MLEPKEYTEEDLCNAFYKGREVGEVTDHDVIFIRSTFNGYLRELDGKEDPYKEWEKRKKL